MVGSGADDPYPNTISLVPTSIAIDHIDSVAGVQVVDGTLPIDFPDLSKKSEKGAQGFRGCR